MWAYRRRRRSEFGTSAICASAPPWVHATTAAHNWELAGPRRFTRSRDLAMQLLKEVGASRSPILRISQGKYSQPKKALIKYSTTKQKKHTHKISFNPPIQSPPQLREANPTDSSSPTFNSPHYL